MTFTPEEKSKLIEDVTVIKTHMVHIKPAVDKNTKFRLYMVGFVLFLTAGLGLIKSVYSVKEAISQDKIDDKRSIKYYKQVHTR